MMTILTLTLFVNELWESSPGYLRGGCLLFSPSSHILAFLSSPPDADGRDADSTVAVTVSA